MAQWQVELGRVMCCHNLRCLRQAIDHGLDKSQTSCSLPPSVCSMRPSLFAMPTAAACLLFSGGFHISALSIQVPPGLAKRLRLDALFGPRHTECVPPQRIDCSLSTASQHGTSWAVGTATRLQSCRTKCSRHSVHGKASCDGPQRNHEYIARRHIEHSSLTPQHSQPCDSRAVNLRCTAQCGAARDVQCERDVRCGGSPHRCGATIKDSAEEKSCSLSR